MKKHTLYLEISAVFEEYGEKTMYAIYKQKEFIEQTNYLRGHVTLYGYSQDEGFSMFHLEEKYPTTFTKAVDHEFELSL